MQPRIERQLLLTQPGFSAEFTQHTAEGPMQWCRRYRLIGCVDYLTIYGRGQLAVRDTGSRHNLSSRLCGHRFGEERISARSPSTLSFRPISSSDILTLATDCPLAFSWGVFAALRWFK